MQKTQEMVGRKPRMNTKMPVHSVNSVVTKHGVFKVGDIITSYHKGFWQLKAIEPRTENVECSPLFYYQLVMDSSFKLKNNKRIQRCDAAFCRKVDENYIKEIKEEFAAKVRAFEAGMSKLLELSA